MAEPQTVEPKVSRKKFDREVALYRKMEAVHRRQGRFLIDATFPEVFAVFAAVKVKPAVLVAGVVLDFTDYDLQPPSVTFVDPFTREPLAFKDLGFAMFRRPPGADDTTVGAMMQVGQLPNMIQANALDARPFLCLPGVREYHDNPAHTGDPWFLHRASCEGSLAFILEKVWTYGVNPIDKLQLVIQTPVISPTMTLEGIPS